MITTEHQSLLSAAKLMAYRFEDLIKRDDQSGSGQGDGRKHHRADILIIEQVLRAVVNSEGKKTNEEKWLNELREVVKAFGWIQAKTGTKRQQQEPDMSRSAV